jgi:hypothetical protein
MYSNSTVLCGTFLSKAQELENKTLSPYKFVQEQGLMFADFECHARARLSLGLYDTVSTVLVNDSKSRRLNSELHCALQADRTLCSYTNVDGKTGVRYRIIHNTVLVQYHMI